MSIDVAAEMTADETTEQGIMAGVAQPSRTLVGRDAELTEIASLLGVRSSADGRADSERRHVVLSGDAGVGKTRLLMELRDLAVADGWRVVAGHCLDFGDSALPYLPFSEVLGRLEAELPELVAKVAYEHPALSRLRPGRRVMGARRADRAEPGESDGSVDRADLFTAVHALLEAAAEPAPLLVVVEDCHWADQSTRDLLSFLFSRPFEGPVAVVASYRSDDLHRRHPLRRQVAEWTRLRGVERIQLSPLPDDDVRALVAMLAPVGLSERELDDDRRPRRGQRVLRRGAGRRRAACPSSAARWTWPTCSWSGSTGSTTTPARRCGSPASPAARSPTTCSPRRPASTRAELEEALRKAVEMNVLVAGEGRYSFRHALLGEAVYDDLLPGRAGAAARRVRRRAGRGPRPRDGRRAGPARPPRQRPRRRPDAAIRAGDEAAAVGGPDEAAQHYQQALELLADPARRERYDRRRLQARRRAPRRR